MNRTKSLVLATMLGTAIPAAAQVQLNGAGATFPNIIYQTWMLAYNQAHPDVKLNYQAIGSGGGIRQFSDGTVDFGGTDAPMTDSAIAAIQGNVLHIPTVMGAVVIAYNLPGLSQPVKFTPDVVADIFLGKITNWNDARLASINAGLTLPSQDIIVVHRSDGSGTSFVFTDYLSKVSPDWQQKVGKGTSPNWPVGLDGADQTYANQTKATRDQVVKTKFPQIAAAFAAKMKGKVPGLETLLRERIKQMLAKKDYAGAMKEMGPNTDFRVSITNSSGAQAYPIASFTWLLVHKTHSDAAKAGALVQFIWWVETEGQTKAPELGYAPLPKDLRPWIQARLKTVTAGGRAVFKAE